MAQQDRYRNETKEKAGETKDNARSTIGAATDTVRSAFAATGEGFRAAGQNTREGAGQVGDNIRSALLGDNPDGRRARIFRKAKAATLTYGIRLTPQRVDANYTANLGRTAAAEFIATLLFVLISAGSVSSLTTVLGAKAATNPASVLAIALAHGLTLALAINLSAAYSGGHVNPAVTLGFVLTSRIDVLAAIVYWVAQLVGAFLGALILWTIFGLKGGLGAHALAPGVSSFGGLEVEIILTFLLTITVWATAVDPRGNKALAPYFIGLSLFVSVIFGFNLTGPSLNPARTFGPALVSGNWAHHWVYWIGPFIGAALAAVVYEVLFIRSTQHDEHDEIYEEILAQEEGRA